MREIGATLRCGFVLTIDYGDTARRLYTPDRRRGTLAVYARQQRGERPLERPGRQDLTAHVNFTALVEAGRPSGPPRGGPPPPGGFFRGAGVPGGAGGAPPAARPPAPTPRAPDAPP